MKKSALLFLILCAALYSSAQYTANQNKVWAFGYGAGLNFASGTPVTFATGISSNEANASICNSAGSLLFYTDGRIVYDRLGVVMPGGAAIVPFPTTSATQGAVIMPFINDPNKYYIFSVEQRETGGGQLAYSIVDMTLNSGLGDIVPGSAGIMMGSGMGEKMIIIPGNSCNAWLLVHKKDLTEFYAYKITTSGVSSIPIVSSLGTFTGINGYAIGAMKCSHDKRKLAVASYAFGTSFGLELYDFNPATGIVSNCQVLETTGSHYGVEFSPDNTKLYASRSPVCQWDVSLSTTAAIIASKTAVSAPATSAMDLRLGPDGKIYVGKGGGTSLDRIDFPNIAGTGCGYVAGAVSLSPSMVGNCLPNLVWNVRLIDGPTAMCAGATTTFTTTLSGGTWGSSDASVAGVSAGGVVTAVAPGTCVISYVTGTGCDGTITVTVTAAPTLTSATICVGNVTAITASTGAGTWTSGSTGIASVGLSTGVVTGLSAGTAPITYHSPGCPATATVVTVNSLSVTGTGAICMGSSLTLSGSPSGGTWSSASTGAVVSSSGVVTGVAAGTAIISYDLGPGCVATATVTVNPAPPISGGTTVCLGSTLTLTTYIPGGTWSSSDISVATIGTSSGLLTGLVGGTTIVTYTTPIGCTSTSVITVGDPATSGGTVCVGGTLTLTCTTPGGTWVSSIPAIGTVTAYTGIVTGVSPGDIIVTYTLWPGCFGTNIVKVLMPSPSDSISLCMGAADTVTGSIAGGIWSSSNTAVATVGTSSGIVSTVAPGTAMLTYTNIGHCRETIIVTVYPMPLPIAGPVTVATGASISLTDPTTGGTWSSGDETIATVSSAGDVTGVAPGTVIIYYTLPSGCKASIVVTVTGSVSVSGIALAGRPSLYPNPATHELMVRTGQLAYTTFTVYNAIGQVMTTYKIAGPEIRISIKALPAGKYKCVFSGAAANEVVQFVKL